MNICLFPRQSFFCLEGKNLHLFLSDVLFHVGYINIYFAGLWPLKSDNPDDFLEVSDPLFSTT